MNQKTTASILPFKKIMPGNIVMVDKNHYCKSYILNSINFDTEPQDVKEKIIEYFGKLVNKFSSKTTFQFLI